MTEQHAPSARRDPHYHGDHTPCWQTHAEDQHAPSTEQPQERVGGGVDLEAIRRRHPRAFDERWALIPGSANSDIHQLTAEVESLRQQLAAAQAEREEERRKRMTLIDLSNLECGNLRAQVDWLNQEHADMHPACSAEPGHCPHEAQIEELRQRASDYEAAEGMAIAQRNKALNEALAYKFQAEAMRGALVEIGQVARPTTSTALRRIVDLVRRALAALDAASAGQPER